jgi:hypothetical protein
VVVWEFSIYIADIYFELFGIAPRFGGGAFVQAIEGLTRRGDEF